VAGDSATVDADGCFWILGRLDDVVNVSGHRLSTIEIESALVADASVQEAGAAGVDDALTGQAVAVFVIPTGDGGALDVTALRARVARESGPIAKPRHVIAVPDLPRTRSGKIMRRLLAQRVHAERDRRRGATPAPHGDLTSPHNPGADTALRAREARETAPIANPRHVTAVPDLPRTRSGKIMRRLLAQLVHAQRDRRRGVTPEPLGDVTSLQNPDAVDPVAAVLTALPA